MTIQIILSSKIEREKRRLQLDLTISPTLEFKPPIVIYCIEENDLHNGYACIWIVEFIGKTLHFHRRKWIAVAEGYIL